MSGDRPLPSTAPSLSAVRSDSSLWTASASSSARRRHLDRGRAVRSHDRRPVRRPGGEGVRGPDVLRLPGQMTDLGREQTARIEPVGDEGQPGGGPGDHAVRARRTGAAPAAPRGRRRPAAAPARRAAARRPARTARPAGRRPPVPSGRPSSTRRTPAQPRAASRCSRASTWRGARSPQRAARPSSAALTRSAPCTTGSVTVPARTSSSVVRVPLQRGARHGRAQRHLGRQWPARRRSARCRSAASTAARAASSRPLDVGEGRAAAAGRRSSPTAKRSATPPSDRRHAFGAGRPAVFA